jgi:hypothetical protein
LAPLSAQLAAVNTVPASAPGDAGRWRLANADGDFDDMASMMARVHAASNASNIYGALQLIIGLGLIFRHAPSPEDVATRPMSGFCNACRLASSYKACLLYWHVV